MLRWRSARRLRLSALDVSNLGAHMLEGLLSGGQVRGWSYLGPLCQDHSHAPRGENISAHGSLRRDELSHQGTAAIKAVSTPLSTS